MNSLSSYSLISKRFFHEVNVWSWKQQICSIRKAKKTPDMSILSLMDHGEIIVTMSVKLYPTRRNFPKESNVWLTMLVFMIHFCYCFDWIDKHILFPNEKVHSKGLKVDIYTRLDQDAKLEADTFAKWELDYIKLDSDTGLSGNFAKLLNETGRRMAMACSWPYYHRRWEGKVRKNIPWIELILLLN